VDAVGREGRGVYVTHLPNYLLYKLNQASSALVNQVVEVRNQNSKSGVQI
jgi:hypothetical protein